MYFLSKVRAFELHSHVLLYQEEICIYFVYIQELLWNYIGGGSIFSCLNTTLKTRVVFRLVFFFFKPSLVDLVIIGMMKKIKLAYKNEFKTWCNNLKSSEFSYQHENSSSVKTHVFIL